MSALKKDRKSSGEARWTVPSDPTDTDAWVRRGNQILADLGRTDCVWVNDKSEGLKIVPFACADVIDEHQRTCFVLPGGSAGRSLD